MKRLLTTLVILTGLFAPSLAVSEEVKMGDLVERGGIFYKKFTDEPFTGKTEGLKQSTFRRGKEHGPWVWYHENGQLSWKGTYKDGKKEGPWVFFNKDGTTGFDGKGSKYHEGTGTYRNDKKVSD